MITPKFSAVFAIGAALENPTFKRAESTPQTIAIKIPLVIFDLFLDSFNYNAHTSAVDSLWAELPILTNVGSSFSSRICGSILNSLGFSNLITYSKKEYEKKAIYFGNNKKEILKIKNSIIESKEKKMFYDIKKYTLKLEKAYQKAHSLRLEKKKPINFEIN